MQTWMGNSWLGFFLRIGIEVVKFASDDLVSVFGFPLDVSMVVGPNAKHGG